MQRTAARWISSRPNGTRGRGHTKKPPGGRLVVRDLCVDRLARKAVRGGRPVPLTPREYGILECLARQTGRAVPARRILEEVWGYDVSPPTTVVETRVCLLRQKLSANGEDEIIHTVRGFGYMLK